LNLPSQLGLGLDPGVYPERACAFARDADLPGEMLNDFNYSGYLMFCLPDRRTFIDQRNHLLYPPEFRARYDAFSSSPELVEEAASQYDIGFSFVGHTSLARHFARRPESWRLVYFDDEALIHTRKPSSLVPFVYLEPGRWGALVGLSSSSLAAARAELDRQEARCGQCLHSRVAAFLLRDVAEGRLAPPTDLVARLRERGMPEALLLDAIAALGGAHAERAVDTLGTYAGFDPIGAAAVARHLGERIGWRPSGEQLRALVGEQPALTAAEVEVLSVLRTAP
jgi:hypothetical protein